MSPNFYTHLDVPKSARYELYAKFWSRYIVSGIDICRLQHHEYLELLVFLLCLYYDRPQFFVTCRLYWALHFEKSNTVDTKIDFLMIQRSRLALVA